MGNSTSDLDTTVHYEELDPRVREALDKANNTYEKWITKIINLSFEKIFWWELNEENTEKFKNFVSSFYALYYLMKTKFSEIYRDSWERYFEHLREVVNNVLDLPHPNVEKVFAAIAHDSIEDVWKTFAWLNEDYWHSVALSVQAISKDPWTEYLDKVILTDEEKKYLSWNQEEYNKLKLHWETGNNTCFESLKQKAKNLRNEEYFSHMESFDSMKNHISSLASKYEITLPEEELAVITQNTLDVKFADRIHNLSTQWNPERTDVVVRKMNETIKYFLPVALATNKVAYDQMKTHLSELKLKLINVSWEVNKILDFSEE